jgi:ectoine hydroxylase-related dioxygenase (phytanoyl-CoA dioxygenase family)
VDTPAGNPPTDYPIVNAAMYFVPISSDHGVTAFLDGSHKLNGHWPDEEKIWGEVGDRFEVVQPTADVGSIVLFSGATLHAARPVLSEQRRYATFNWFGTPWMVSPRSVKPYLLERHADERLRSLFRDPPSHEFLAILDVD